MKRPLYVMVPRLDGTGAIKGAIALCNGLSRDFSITLICLKGIVSRAGLSPDVTVLPLDLARSFLGKYRLIRAMLESQSGQPTVISLGFSADLMNFFFRSRVKTIASLRGNISSSYPMKYGLAGFLLSRIHFFLLRRFNRVVVLSQAMKKRGEDLKLKNLSVVGNFVDEPQLEVFRQSSPEALKKGKKTILFIGNFIKRKRADLMIQAATLLRDHGIDFQLLMMGDGPLRQQVQRLAANRGLEEEIRFPGHIQNPYPLIQTADLMVLPSESEGIPRAALESLFFGIPCILRNVDANPELIQPGINGYLFDSDGELGSVIAKALQKASLKSAGCLIPNQFRYTENIKRIREVLKNGINH